MKIKIFLSFLALMVTISFFSSDSQALPCDWEEYVYACGFNENCLSSDDCIEGEIWMNNACYVVISHSDICQSIGDCSTLIACRSVATSACGNSGCTYSYEIGDTCNTLCPSWAPQCVNGQCTCTPDWSCTWSPDSSTKDCGTIFEQTANNCVDLNDCGQTPPSTQQAEGTKCPPPTFGTCTGFFNNCDSTGSQTVTTYSNCDITIGSCGSSTTSQSCTRSTGSYNSCDLTADTSCGIETACSDGIDNDCDGSTDNSDQDCIAPPPFSSIVPTLSSPANGATVNTLTPTLSWQTVTGAGCYAVNVGSVTWYTSNTFYDIPSNNLVNGNTYNWKVQAFNDICNNIGIATVSQWSNSWSFTVSTAVAQKTITVTSPNGGETWTIGTSKTITWTSTGSVGNVDINISRDGGSSWTAIVTDTANDGSHSWTVTSPATTQALIRVRERADVSVVDRSNAVFIVSTTPPACTVDANCNDNNSCTQDVCSNSVCNYNNLSDGTVCTIDSQSGTCQAGVCVVTGCS